jgi:hypothetical protein
MAGCSKEDAFGTVQDRDKSAHTFRIAAGGGLRRVCACVWNAVLCLKTLASYVQ